jgi:hypothetical protein
VRCPSVNSCASPQAGRERLVGPSSDGRLALGLAPGAASLALPDAPQGSVPEVASIAAQIVRELAERVRRFGGAGLIIDYGHGDSANRRHAAGSARPHGRRSPLRTWRDRYLSGRMSTLPRWRGSRPRPARRVFGPTTQRAFLESLGITQRAATLSAAASEDDRAAIAAALDRLTGEAAMGTLFKVMAVTAPARPRGQRGPIRRAADLPPAVAGHILRAHRQLCVDKPHHFRAPSLDLPGISHAFFTREGGISRGLYASLNGGQGSGDDPRRCA